MRVMNPPPLIPTEIRIKISGNLVVLEIDQIENDHPYSVVYDPEEAFNMAVAIFEAIEEIDPGLVRKKL